MYYSIDTTTDMCGQTCINDNMYILYKLFEPGLTKADQNLICPKKGCHSRDITWEQASGKGTIYTFAIQHIATDGWKEAVPFVTAFIDTEEDVRMLSVIANANPEDPASIKIGANVVIKFEKVEDEIFMPYCEII